MQSTPPDIKVCAETMLTIAAKPKYLGAMVGIIGVRRTWGLAMRHHPHAHMVIPSGGIL